MCLSEARRVPESQGSVLLKEGRAACFAVCLSAFLAGFNLPFASLKSAMLNAQMSFLFVLRFEGGRHHVSLAPQSSFCKIDSGRRVRLKGCFIRVYRLFVACCKGNLHKQVACVNLITS